MRRIILLQSVSLDGYFEGPNHDLSWIEQDYEAFDTRGEYTIDAFLFGHRTYDLVKAFWSTDQGMQTAPEMAKSLTDNVKIVASRVGFEPGWNNVKVITGNVIGQIRKIKTWPGADLMMFGSNQLVVSLMEEGLVDAFQIIVRPVAIGKGTPLFAGLKKRVALDLKNVNKFKSGAVMLTYEPK